MEQQTELNKRSELVRLSADNARFSSNNALLALDYQRDGEWVHEARVLLKRAFPFDMPFQYIAALDSEEREIGMIVSLKDFDAVTEELLREELARIYYTPKILRILSLKERYGFSYWQVVTEEGEAAFTVQDTFRNLLRIGENRAAIFDVDGNRFEIEDIAALDRKSYKKIELYL